MKRWELRLWARGSVDMALHLVALVVGTDFECGLHLPCMAPHPYPLGVPHCVGSGSNPGGSLSCFRWSRPLCLAPCQSRNHCEKRGGIEEGSARTAADVAVTYAGDDVRGEGVRRGRGAKMEEQWRGEGGGGQGEELNAWKVGEGWACA